MDSAEKTSSSGSILDRVLQSQQSFALEHFDPTDVVNEILRQVSEKEADVLRRRYGLGREHRETLEKIGHRYQVTRERVRQIERWAVVQVRKSSITKTLLHDLDLLLQQLLETHGGLMLEDDLFQALHAQVTQTPQTRAAVEFLLLEMLPDKVERVETRAFKLYWRLTFGNDELLPKVVAEAGEVIRAHGQPLNQATLLQQLRARPLIQAHPGLTDEVLLSYLNVAVSVERNPFGEFGLREWGSIVPRRMHDKILLVMRKHHQPMHFQEITQRINELGFDRRQAYAPTVHNELILNDEYVLIGRGIYALREWGYQPGVVADVIESILRKSGPLVRDELVAKVLEQRRVRRNTIHLALTNKRRFVRMSDGRYGLANTTVS